MSTIPTNLTLAERLTRLENAIAVKDDGVVFIRAKKLVVNSMTIELDAPASVLVKGGVVQVTALTTLKLQAGAGAFLKAGIIKLNDGTRPVATVGSRVIPHLPLTHKVDTGNGTVLA